jgi:hypothetical protein
MPPPPPRMEFPGRLKGKGEHALFHVAFPSKPLLNVEIIDRGAQFVQAADCQRGTG